MADDYARPTGDNPSLASISRGAEPVSEGGEVSRIEIEPAANGGFTARCFRRSTAQGDGGSSPYQEPKSYAFSHYYGLEDWLGKELGVAVGDEEEPGQGELAPPSQNASQGNLGGSGAYAPGMASGSVSRA